MDQHLSVCSQVTEQRHVKRSYDGTAANELDVLLCGEPHPRLDLTNWGHCLVLKRRTRMRTRTAMTASVLN